MLSRSVLVSSPPPLQGGVHMTPVWLPSTRWRKQSCSASGPPRSQSAGLLPPPPRDPSVPPKGSPSVPSQCRGNVFLRPRTGMVLRISSSSVQAPKKQAPPIRHRS
jgi:hypothetical protein